MNDETHTLNVVLEWLTLLLRIREIPGPNLGTETGYTDWFLWFFSDPPGKCQDITLKLFHDLFLANSLSFNLHLSLSHSTLYSLRYWRSVAKQIKKIKQIKDNACINITRTIDMTK
jgi:hypothetical protein